MYIGVEAHYNGQKTLSQIFFQNYATFNIHETNIKRGFHKLYSNMVVQFPNNIIVKRNNKILINIK